MIEHGFFGRGHQTVLHGQERKNFVQAHDGIKGKIDQHHGLAEVVDGNQAGDRQVSGFAVQVVDRRAFGVHVQVGDAGNPMQGGLQAGRQIAAEVEPARQAQGADHGRAGTGRAFRVHGQVQGEGVAFGGDLEVRQGQAAVFLHEQGRKQLGREGSRTGRGKPQIAGEPPPGHVEGVVRRGGTQGQGTVHFQLALEQTQAGLQAYGVHGFLGVDLGLDAPQLQHLFAGGIEHAQPALGDA